MIYRVAIGLPPYWEDAHHQDFLRYAQSPKEVSRWKRATLIVLTPDVDGFVARFIARYETLARFRWINLSLESSFIDEIDAGEE